MENDETIALRAPDKASPNMEDNSISSLGSQQSTPSFPSSNNLTGHHQRHHHDRPLLSSATKDGGGGGGGGGGPAMEVNESERYSCSRGPRTSISSTNIFHDDIAAAVPIFTRSDPTVVPRTLQPFAISTTPLSTPGGGMAASPLEFPFTAAQWRELERQAMIYKYMMASLPVPTDILLPSTSRKLSADPTASLSNGSMYSLRCGNRDLEPGRCKRTDGKKWRCSRDVAPHQKYCERHMHRGRPRSRKHVEVHPPPPPPPVDARNNSKKTRLHQSPPEIAVPFSDSGSQNINDTNFAPLFHGTAAARSQPKVPLVLSGEFCGNISKSSYKEPNRATNWMMDSEMAGATNGVEQQWLYLMDAKKELADKDESIFGTNTSVLQGGNYEEEALSLFSYPGLVPEDIHNHRSGDCDMFMNSDLVSLKQPQMEDQYSISRGISKGFFDAWSNGNMKTMNNDSASSSQGNFSPTSLNLSIAMAAGDDLCHSAAESNRHHHEPKDWPASSWLPFPSGGPLAEVLQPSSINGGSSPTSPFIGNGDPISPSATAASSPSGVLHKALFTASDGSVCNSPTIAPSSAPPDVIGFQWLS